MSAALMLQGTGSDVGKSLLLAALARAFSQRGLRVCPFKPQNMSNNAAVTVEGGEIGRAQALQARACGTPPSNDMNPVLLKPQSDVGAQVVVQGQVMGNADALDYQALKPHLLGRVLESFERLRGRADLVLVEGAGSPAEVNLREHDIANMGFAEAAGVPVVLVADIERGGVIASIVGTHLLLTEAERALLKGYLINKFRGDLTLFDAGIEIIERETGLECLGVVPYLAEAGVLPAEDSVVTHLARPRDVTAPIQVAVPLLPRIANFDDLDPLIQEPDVSVAFVPPGQALPGDLDLIVLPGSKSTLADLRFLCEQGWDVDTRAHVRRGGWVVGLCGGYQMLGRRLGDPQGTEGVTGEADGLGLLEIRTELSTDKCLVEARGVELESGESVRGYEMHMGVTRGPGLARPLLELDGRPEGAVSPNGRILGCYLHGLFNADGFRHAFLSRIRKRRRTGLAFDAEVEQALDRLAAHLERHTALDRLLQVAQAMEPSQDGASTFRPGAAQI